jgi:SAM-dependent methyltransferase
MILPEGHQREDRPRGQSVREYWDLRHATSRPEASGTLTHSSAANKWFYRAKKKRIADIMHRSQISLKGLRVLDAACGNGEFVDFFLREGAESILGLDISTVAIDLCKKRFSATSRCRFKCFDLSEELPTEMGGTFDLGCCFEAIFALTSREDFQVGLRNLCTALRPGGYLLISDHYPPTSERRHDKITYHGHDLYKNIFREKGLQEIGMYLQTTVFNDIILPHKIQSCVEIYLPWSLYALDRLLLHLRKPAIPSTNRMYYLIAQKEL